MPDRPGSITVPASAPASLERAAAELRAGAIVAIPTETVYGLAVLPVEVALARLVAAKRRSPEKGIALLVDSLEQVRQVAVVTDSAERLAQRFWPGPLTLILPKRADRVLPELLTGGRPTIAVRLPDHQIPRSLARRLGPIATSSANVSGQSDATTAEQVATTLGNVVSMIIDDGPVRGGVPSTVVECLAGAQLIILRAGAIAVEEVRAAGRK